MKHARSDYNRFQDPAGEPDRHVYDFLGRLASVVEAAADDTALVILAEVVKFFGVKEEDVARRVVFVREFAARANIDGHPFGLDEPVFVIRGQDVCAPAAIAAYAEMARLVGADDISEASREWANYVRLWQVEGGGRATVPDLPATEELG